MLNGRLVIQSLTSPTVARNALQHRTNREIGSAYLGNIMIYIIRTEGFYCHRKEGVCSWEVLDIRIWE